MADQFKKYVVDDTYTPVKKKLRDMGDGTHAEVVSVADAAGVMVKSGPGTTVSVVIANGATLSPSVDLGNGRLGRIGCPSNIDGNTKLSFMTSHDNVTFRVLRDEYGVEYTVVPVVDSGVVPNLGMFAAARYLKVRFGTSTAAGTAATASRTFDLTLLA